MEDQEPNYQLTVKGLLLAFFTKINRFQGGFAENSPDLAQENKNVPMIIPALEYIERNYMQQFSIEFLAQLCHFSPTHFRRVFHDIMGTSPLNYINTTRIMKACSLLRNTQEPVLNISEAVGFHSISSFNRLFIRILQLSPREYRQQILDTDYRKQ